MRGTLVFVHGTGVREASLEKTWESFQRGAHRNGFEGISLEFCDWGPAVGPDLDLIDASLPVTAAPALADVAEEDSAAAWELLVDDPLFELRLAAEAAPRTSGPPVPGRARPDQAAQVLMGGLAHLEERDVDGLLVASGVSGDELRLAGQRVAQSPEFGRAALAAGSEVDEDYLEAVARAIVAQVLSERRDDPPGLQPEVAFRRQLRTRLVDLLVRTLFPGTTRAIGAWLKKKVVRFVASRVTDVAVARRRGMTGLASSAIADILYYQRRGEEIRAYVARSLQGRSRPLTVVGHSLGGVILVDLLSSDVDLPVDLLVTIGSQSPLFYAIDALELLRPGAGRDPFMPWLNIYSDDDLLSYCAERVFPGHDLIVDYRVDAGVPFPESHSAYWVIDDVFDAIREAWPEEM